MRIGMHLNYAGGFTETVTELADYQKARLDIVFVPEAYSFDAVSQLGFIAAKTGRLEIGSGIFQLYSRTPALTPMTAAGLDYVSGGRFTLGLGPGAPGPLTRPAGRSGVRAAGYRPGCLRLSRSGPAGLCPVHRRDGAAPGPRAQLLLRARGAVRVRGDGGADPGRVPGRPQGRGGRAGARRTPRGHVADRPGRPGRGAGR